MASRRQFTIRLAAAAATLGLAGAAGAAEFTMRLSHQFPPTHHTAVSLEQFAKDVAAATKGRAEVQIFGAAQLFKPAQHHAAVASGKVESAVMLSFQWGGSIPEMSVTVIPYLMTSVAKQKAFMGSEAARLLDAKMAAKGVTNIAWIVDTNDGIFTSAKKPLVAPSDFAGLKIRGLNKLFDAGLAAMGAAPSAMPGSEVYQALQTGVLDGAITSSSSLVSYRIYEQVKCLTAPGANALWVMYEPILMAKESFAKLNPQQQAELMKAAQAAEEYAYKASIEADQKLVDAYKNAGVKVVEMSAEQAAMWRKIADTSSYKAFADDVKGGRELLDQALSVE